MNKRRIGNRWETLASSYLEKNNFKIIDRNFYVKCGEIDIIAIKNGMLHFIEVKYRKNNLYGEAVCAVSYKKTKKIINAAKLYLLKNNINFDTPISFDILAIQNDVISFIENAFEV